MHIHCGIAAIQCIRQHALSPCSCCFTARKFCEREKGEKYSSIGNWHGARKSSSFVSLVARESVRQISAKQECHVLWLTVGIFNDCIHTHNVIHDRNNSDKRRLQTRRRRMEVTTRTGIKTKLKSLKIPSGWCPLVLVPQRVNASFMENYA